MSQDWTDQVSIERDVDEDELKEPRLTTKEPFWSLHCFCRTVCVVQVNETEFRLDSLEK